MLSQILREFRESGGVINLNELSQRLGVARSALDGMLETLQGQGKLTEVAETVVTDGCHDCSSCHVCKHNQREENMVKAYQMAVSSGPPDKGVA